MKRKDSWLTFSVRIVAYLLIVTAYVLLLSSLFGCRLVTEGLSAVGVPVRPGAAGEAAKADAAIIEWLWALIGIGVSEGTRATTRAVKRRAAKRTEAREAKRRADEILKAKVT